MNILRFSIFCAISYFFALLEISFFPYFAWRGAVPNLVFALFFFCMFWLQRQEYAEAFFSAMVAGFLLDMTNHRTFGISMGSFVAIFLAERLTSHFVQQFSRVGRGFYFFLAYTGAFFIYQIVLYVAANILGNHFEGFGGAAWSFIYGFPFILAVYGIYYYLFAGNQSENQLSLFS